MTCRLAAAVQRHQDKDHFDGRNSASSFNTSCSYSSTSMSKNSTAAATETEAAAVADAEAAATASNKFNVPRYLIRKL